MFYLDTKSLNNEEKPLIGDTDEDKPLIEDTDDKTLLDMSGDIIPIQVNALK